MNVLLLVGFASHMANRGSWTAVVAFKLLAGQNLWYCGFENMTNQLRLIEPINCISNLPYAPQILIDADSVHRNDIAERKHCCGLLLRSKSIHLQREKLAILHNRESTLHIWFNQLQPCSLEQLLELLILSISRQLQTAGLRLRFLPCHATVKLIKLILTPCAQVLFEHDKTVLVFQHRFAPLQELQ